MADHSQHQTSHTDWQAERLIPDAVPWHKKRMIEEHMKRYQFAAPFVRHKRVVDLACGTGYGCATLAQARARSVIGVDINTEAIAYAKKQYDLPAIRYVQADVTATNLPEKSADIITSFETVEHLKNEEKFIQEIRRLLKPNGLLIISTPNVEFSVGNNPFHIREYTFDECLVLLKDFKSVDYFGQRKVIRPLFKLMKLVPPLSAFRPWENVQIEKIPVTADTNYCYFIFICRT